MQPGVVQRAKHVRLGGYLASYNTLHFTPVFQFSSFFKGVKKPTCAFLCANSTPSDPDIAKVLLKITILCGTPEDSTIQCTVKNCG